MKNTPSYFLLFLLFVAANLAIYKHPKQVILKGSVSDNAKLYPAEMKISIFKKNSKLSDTKTDKFGNYEIVLPEDGEYDFILSENNPYYYIQKDTDIVIPSVESQQHDFKITINKQELKHKCTRLVEACRHLEKNPGNTSFKGISYARFPSNMNEFQLFFCTKVPHENLKKDAQKVIADYYKFKLVSDTAYFSKYALINIGYTDKCELKSLDYLSAGLVEYLKKNPESFFDVIKVYSNEQITCILKNLLRKIPKEQHEAIFGKLPAYNGRIYSIFNKINSEAKSK